MEAPAFVLSGAKVFGNLNKDLKENAKIWTAELIQGVKFQDMFFEAWLLALRVFLTSYNAIMTGNLGPVRIIAIFLSFSLLFVRKWIYDVWAERLHGFLSDVCVII